MKTKTVELHPSQVKIHYLDEAGNVITSTNKIAHVNRARIEFIDTNISPELVIKVRFPVLDFQDKPDENKNTIAKVRVTYLEPSAHEIKYASKLKNWISAKE